MKHVAVTTRGPVSRKVLAALEKELGRKVLNFEAFRLGAERAANLERGVVSEEEMARMKRIGSYIYTNHKHLFAR